MLNRLGVALCCGWFGLSLAQHVLAEPAAPIVPGYEQLIHAPKPVEHGTGELLLGELNCSACHQTQSPRIDRKGAPDLSDAGARITSQYIRAFVTDPHQVKPGTTMPDLLRGLDAQTKTDDVDALTQYLVSLGWPTQPSSSVMDQMAIDAGKKLYESVGCVACHAPAGKTDTAIPSVPLPNLAMKTTVAELTEFLLNPAKIRPASRMPNLGLTPSQAMSIAVYLLRDQANNPQNKDAKPVVTYGVHYDLYLKEVDNCDIENLKKLTPDSRGTLTTFSLGIPDLPLENFAIVFTANLEIKTAGNYRFSTVSDDGSRLYIDGKQVVLNDGPHAAQEKSGLIKLTAGKHDIVVTYFQAADAMVIKVNWHVPGTRERGPIDPQVLTTQGSAILPLETETLARDQQKIDKGKQLFASLGCAACHQMQGITPSNSAKSLADLNPAADGGCLGSKPGNGVPAYDLREDQIKAITATLTDKQTLGTQLTSAELVNHDLAKMNCYACHNRDGVGGPAADRLQYFVMTSPFDMGDEGKLPPSLTNVGAKLLPEAIDKIVCQGKLHIRPVLATHMPMFEAARLEGFSAALEQTDDASPDQNPPFTVASANDGRRLVGTRGLGCVNCHGVDDAKSLGMPAPNLSLEHERLRFGWFTKLLENPAKVNRGTRMPSFWDGGDVALKNIAGGTEAGQIDAIWNYISEGQAMALPIGLQPGGFELIPTDTPIVHRTFVAPDIFVPGQVGRRAILVGYPEALNIGFDADAVRLAVAWRGRFFDAGGEWIARGGQALKPMGTDLLHMPDGPAFAFLDTLSSPWPQIVPDARYVGGHFKGYVLDKAERPTFKYVLNDVTIEETPLPLVGKSADLLRQFHLTSSGATHGLYFVIASGKNVEQTAPDVWSADGYSVKIDAAGMKPIVRDNGPQKQVLLPIVFTNGQASFNATLHW